MRNPARISAARWRRWGGSMHGSNSTGWWSARFPPIRKTRRCSLAAANVYRQRPAFRAAHRRGVRTRWQAAAAVAIVGPECRSRSLRRIVGGHRHTAITSARCNCSARRLAMPRTTRNALAFGKCSAGCSAGRKHGNSRRSRPSTRCPNGANRGPKAAPRARHGRRTGRCFTKSPHHGRPRKTMASAGVSRSRNRPGLSPDHGDR